MRFGANIFIDRDAPSLIRSCREAGLTLIRLVGDVVTDEVRAALIETKMSVYYVPIYAIEAAISPALLWLGRPDELVEFYRNFCALVRSERTLGVALPEGLENAIKVTNASTLRGWSKEQVRLIVDRTAKAINDTGHTAVLPASPGAIASGDWQGLSFGVYDIYHPMSEAIVGDLKMRNAITVEAKKYWFGHALSFDGDIQSMVKAKMIRKVAGIKTDAEFGFVHIRGSATLEDFGALGATMRDLNSGRRMSGDENLADWKRAKRER